MQQTLLNGRYEFEQKIGEGGMATVYRGLDRRLNRRVAIKVLHSQYVDDPDFLSRFQHEAQAAAILTHPSVVNVYDVGQDGNFHYIVMEYVSGENLKTLINREAPLPVAQAVSIAEAAAYGLESAHQVGMIHRDIKPQNIMVMQDGHIRITDFGIAKSDFSTSLTQTGVTFGTADYISPEQAQGLSATPQSDIYSLGVTLFEMLTGKLPFTGDSAVSVAMQHVGSEPPALRQLNPQVPYQLEALINQALAKDPAERPASAREFAQLLHYYRNLADQQTSFTPHVASAARSSATRSAGASSNSGNSGSRGSFPPPRSTVAKAPQSQNTGCGVFVVGLLLLGGVLGLVLMFSIGAFTPSPRNDPPTPSPLAGVIGMDEDATETPGATGTTTAVAAASTATATATATGTVTPTPQPTDTATPTPSATPTASPTSPPLVSVPDIRNLSEANARNTLSQAQLIPVAGGSRNDSNVPAGLIIDQAIGAGSQVQIGAPVTYTVSLGPTLVQVPDLVQVNINLAISQLQTLGLGAQVSEEPNLQVSENFVIRQSPNPGARVPPGEAVNLVVSIGNKVQFPNVIGQTRDIAVAILQSNGFGTPVIDEQGPDRLANFNSYFPNQVVSAQVNGLPVDNGDYVTPGASVVLGVRAP